MAAERLEGRERDILAAIVGMHIVTKAPVSSSAVASKKKGGLSSATIRNEMASLEEAGYLHQPHTSAGRVPTAKAYEFYAREVAARARLSAANRELLNRALAPKGAGAEGMLARAPHVLSEFCRCVGLVLAPPLAVTVLDQVRFVRLDQERVLVVLVTRSGRLCDKVVRTRERFRADELERMSAYVNQHFRGWTLESIRAEMDRRVASERSDFLRRALALCRESFDPRSDPDVLRVEGMAHLVEEGTAASPEELRALLQALEEKERLTRLLSDCLESPERPLRIVIGLEWLAPAMKDYALIGAAYGDGARLFGSLGLLGPTRMDYVRAVTAASYVATLFDRVLAEN